MKIFKNYKSPLIHRLTNGVKRLIFFVGFIFTFLLILLTINSASDSFSWFKDSYKLHSPSSSKIFQTFVNQKFGDKYSSLRFKDIGTYIKKVVGPSSLQLDTINLNIDFESMAMLEENRIDKLSNNSVKLGEKKYISASIVHTDINNVVETYNVKLRPKGDRALHKNNFNTMSFKVDIKGKKRLFGFEEFSIQDPVIRNYSFEILIGKFIKLDNILAVNTIPVQFYVNGVSRGIYHVEEGFGKELVERNNKKNGPIASIDEENGFVFPLIDYDYYSHNYWEKNQKDILDNFKYNLNYVKSNYKNKNFNLCHYYDCRLWGIFFAHIDFFGAHHGGLEKSVKYYFNSSTGLIEPIFFDGHIVTGTYLKNQILGDLLTNGNSIEFDGYHNIHKEWYKLFFNTKNSIFLNSYINKISYLSSLKGLKKIRNLFDLNIEPLNIKYYKSFMQADGVYGHGLLPFYFNFDSFIYERTRLIKSKLVNIMSFITASSEPNSLFSKIKFKHFEIDNYKKDINEGGFFEANNLLLKNTTVTFKKFSLLLLNGNTKISNVRLLGPVMVVQNGGSFSSKNLLIQNGENRKIPGRNWSGVLNLINSTNTLHNLSVEQATAEDALNIVNSQTNATNINISKSLSDAIDIDFGYFQFDKISCLDIKNDCLDMSGADAKGNELIAGIVTDKAISLGEKSILNLKTLKVYNSEIGLVAKDGSFANISNFYANKTRLHIASYTKKNMFRDNNNVEVKFFINAQKKNNFLISRNTIFSLNGQSAVLRERSKDIEKQLYGNQYGLPTNKRN